MHDQLPKIYCFISDYDKNYIKRLNKNIAIIYRNYDKALNKEEIKQIRNLCRKTKKKFFLANNIKVAFQLNLDGVYIPSFNKKIIINNHAKRKKFMMHTIGSQMKLKKKFLQMKLKIIMVALCKEEFTKKRIFYLGK